MEWSWTVFFLVAVAAGVQSQVQLTQSGAEVRKPGTSVKVSCKASGYTFTDYVMHWVRQAPGKGLEWMGWINPKNSNIRYAQKFEDRATVTADTSSNTAFMQLSGLSFEDTAMYYCARSKYCTGFSCNGPYYGMDVWSPGSMVTISSESQTSPKVFPLSLGHCDMAAGTTGQVVVGCLASSFFPLPATMQWDYSGNSAINFPPTATNGGPYTMSSLLTMPADQCPESKSLNCQVTHAGTIKSASVPCTIVSDVPCCTPQCPACDKPRLSLHKPALEDLLLGFDAKLTCKLSGLKKPEKALFTWTPSNGKEAILGSPQQDDCGCYSVSSMLPGCADPWNHGDTFSCSVTHPEVEGTLTATISKQKGNTFRPQVHLLPPPSEELALNELVTLTCLVRGFHPSDVMVRWLQGSQELQNQDYVTSTAQPEPGQGVSTYTVTSLLRVDAKTWKNGENFSCLVGHESLPANFMQKSIDHLAGKPSHVNVSVVVTDVDGNCY